MTCPHGRDPSEPCLPCQLARVEETPKGPVPFCPNGHDGASFCPECDMPSPAIVRHTLEVELQHLREQVAASEALLKSTIETLSNIRLEEVAEATERERARCRAIVLRYYANDWRGNQALAEIDAGAL